MHVTGRARLAALTLLAVVAGSASAGAAALARDGFCFHHLLGLTRPGAMAGMPMDGMAAPAAPAAGACPILLVIALAAAVLFVLLLGAVRHAAVVALAAAFRLLAPGADAPWALGHAAVLVQPGVRLARRRPSRAPPLRA